MRISALIAELQEQQAEYGDIPVLSTDGCGCCSWLTDPSPQPSVVDGDDNADLAPGTRFLLLNY